MPGRRRPTWTSRRRKGRKRRQALTVDRFVLPAVVDLAAAAAAASVDDDDGSEDVLVVAFLGVAPSLLLRDVFPLSLSPVAVAVFVSAAAAAAQRPLVQAPPTHCCA